MNTWHCYSDYEYWNARDVCESMARRRFAECKEAGVPAVLFHGIKEIDRC